MSDQNKHTVVNGKMAIRVQAKVGNQNGVNVDLEVDENGKLIITEENQAAIKAAVEAIQTAQTDGLQKTMVVDSLGNILGFINAETVKTETTKIIPVQTIDSKGRVQDGCLYNPVINKCVDVDLLSALKTMQPERLAGSSFSGTQKDPNFWAETPSALGSGSVTQNGAIFLNTGTTADSSIKYNTVKKGRKIPGTENEFRFVGRLSTAPQVNNIRRAGVYTATDGYFFQANGTVFQIVSRKGGVDTAISSGDFNGDVESVTLDTSIHRLVIKITSVSAKFIFDGVLIHTISALTSPSVSSLTLPVAIENINLNGNTTNNEIQVLVAVVLRNGRPKSETSSKLVPVNATTILKYNAGFLERIINLDNAGTISIYDGQSAAGVLKGTIDAVKVVGSIELNMNFSDGLTIVSTSNAKVLAIYE